jgi:Transposase and inactivated derivatives
MQGTKEYNEKLFVNFRLSERIPQDNFYRKLKSMLNLSFLRSLTKKYYGSEGQKSIDPEVFFKLMLIGYMENVNSDRKIIEQASMRMDMLYFLGYDIDEPLPWHSTLSRTRKLYGEEVFLELFRKVLTLCVERGLVSGRVQAVDSAFIAANASMDSLEEHSIDKFCSEFYNKITESEECEEGRNKDNQDSKQPGARKDGRKYNDRYRSSTDPEARVSQKPNKPSRLNYLGQISVDTASHIICGAMADFADKKDSNCTRSIVGQTVESLETAEIKIESVLADTSYSSGESLKYLSKQGITAYIPPNSGYKHSRQDFFYNPEDNSYTCSQGVKLTYRGLKRERGRTTVVKRYQSLINDCKHCSLKAQCVGKMGYKQIYDSVNKPYYDESYYLMNTPEGQRMRRLRSSTVEPVLGSLLLFGAMKNVYTKGLALANKHVLMAAAAYNIKKLATRPYIKSAVRAIESLTADLIDATCQLYLRLGTTLSSKWSFAL